MEKYDFKLDLNSNNSLKLINDRIRDNSKILEFGSANGRLTKHLSINRNCLVDIVEINEISGADASKYANKIFIGSEKGNIEKYIWLKELENDRYDFIIFADVLEHLRDPEKVLKECKKLLKDDGSVLVSIPNIANNSIILSLVRDEFNYTSVGLLDDTHIHFFTYKTFNKLIEKIGYSVKYVDMTIGRVGETEIPINYEMFQGYDLSLIQDHILGNAYQYVYELKLNYQNLCGLIENEVEKWVEKEKITKYIPVVYFFYENKYTQKNILKPVLFKRNGDCFLARFNINKLMIENKIRLDPIEGYPCKLEIVSIETDAINYFINNSGIYNAEENTYKFITLDPNLEICGDFSNATYISFCYKISILNKEDIIILFKEREKYVSKFLMIYYKLRDKLKFFRGRKR